MGCVSFPVETAGVASTAGGKINRSLQIVRNAARDPLAYCPSDALTCAGGEVGSTSVALKPGTLRTGAYSADTKTAGSCTIMLQAALPCLLYAEPSSSG